MKLLTVMQAAERVGVHPDTVRRWANSGELPCTRLNARGDRRFSPADVDRMVSCEGEPQAPVAGPVQVACYVRVSGRADQLSSLKTQEDELRASIKDGQEFVKLYKDIGSGLSEKRKGLRAALDDAREGRFDELRVTHSDRLTRFGELTLRELFASYGVRVVVLHERQSASPEAELMADFMALIASFSGRLYGQRSVAAKQRLLARVKVGQADNDGE